MLDIEVTSRQITENRKLDPSNCYHFPTHIWFALELIGERIPDRELQRLRDDPSHRYTDPHIYHFKREGGGTLEALPQGERQKVRDILNKAAGCRSIVWE
jgi:hypothetical protein